MQERFITKVTFDKRTRCPCIFRVCQISYKTPW